VKGNFHARFCSRAGVATPRLRQPWTAARLRIGMNVKKSRQGGGPRRNALGSSKYLMLREKEGYNG